VFGTIFLPGARCFGPVWIWTGRRSDHGPAIDEESMCIFPFYYYYFRDFAVTDTAWEILAALMMHWCPKPLVCACDCEVFLVGCLVGTSAWQVWRAVQLWRRSVLHAGGLFCSYELWRLWNGTGVGGLMSLACSLLCDFCWNVEPQKRCSRIQFTSFAASS